MFNSILHLGLLTKIESSLVIACQITSYSTESVNL